MRSASLVGAAEAVKARLDANLDGGSRQLVASVLQRADEPGELLGYWHSRYGRVAEPKPVKRGIADAVMRLYDEFALLKYDTAAHGYRFADVIERVHVTGEHPEVKGTWRGDLYEYAIDRRHNRDNPVPETLAMIRANASLRARAAEDPRALLDADAIRAAGMTWEDALSLTGSFSEVSRRDLWTALIPSMGYTALLRNLRNFDEAGVPDTVAAEVAGRRDLVLFDCEVDGPAARCAHQAVPVRQGREPAPVSGPMAERRVVSRRRYRDRGGGPRTLPGQFPHAGGHSQR